MTLHSKSMLLAKLSFIFYVYNLLIYNLSKLLLWKEFKYSSMILFPNIIKSGRIFFYSTITCLCVRSALISNFSLKWSTTMVHQQNQHPSLGHQHTRLQSGSSEVFHPDCWIDCTCICTAPTAFLQWDNQSWSWAPRSFWMYHHSWIFWKILIGGRNLIGGNYKPKKC